MWPPYSIAISPPRSLIDGRGHEPITNGIPMSLFHNHVTMQKWQKVWGHFV